MIGHVDKVINLVDPLIRWLFKYFLGSYLDLEHLDFSQLFEKGLSNLTLDHTRINQTHLKDSPLLVERCRIEKMSVKINIKEKSVRLTIDGLDLALFANEDIVGMETARKASESKINPPDQQIPSSLQKGFISNFLKTYLLELTLNNSTVCIRPTRPTCPSEHLELSVKEISVKKLADSNSNNSKNTTHYVLKTSITNVSARLLPKEHDLTDESFVDATRISQHGSLVLHMHDSIKVDSNILLKDDALSFTTKAKIPKIVVLVSPGLVALLSVLQLKFSNFANSFLIQNEQDYEKLAQSQNGLNFSAVRFNLEERFECFITKLNGSIASSPLDESNAFDTSQLLKSFSIESAKANLELCLNHLVLIFYNPLDWDVEVNPERICEELDDGFISFFPFENSQIVLTNCSFKMEKSEIKGNVDQFAMRNFKLMKNIKPESIDRTLNTSSMMMHSFNETLYESSLVFELVPNMDSLQNNIILEKSEDPVLYDENTMPVRRRESTDSLVFNQMRKEGLEVSIKVQKKPALKFRVSDKLLVMVLETVNMNIDNLLEFADTFIGNLHQAIKATIMTSKVTQRSETYTAIETDQFFKYFVSMIDKEKIEKLYNFRDTITPKTVLLLASEFTFSCIADLLSISSNAPNLSNFFEAQKISFSNKNVRQQSCKFLKVKEATLLNLVSFKMVEATSKNLNLTTLRNDLEMKVQKVELKAVNKLEAFCNKRIVSVLKDYQSRLASLAANSNGFDALYPLLKNAYELLPQKANLNELLNEIVLKSLPAIKTFDMVSFLVDQIEVSVYDNNESNFTAINKQFRENENKLKSLNILTEQSLFVTDVIHRLQLIHLTIKDVNVCVSLSSQEVMSEIKTVCCKLMEYHNNIVELHFYDLKASSSARASVFINKIKCDLNFSYKLVNIFTLYLTQNVVPQIKKILEEIPNQPTTPSRPNSSPNSEQNASLKLSLCVNELDISCQQLVSGIRAILKKIEVDENVCQVEELALWKLSANESVIHDKLFELKSLKLDKLSHLSISEIQAWIKNEYIVIIKDFVQRMTETIQNVIKQLSEPVNDIVNKSLAVSSTIGPETPMLYSTLSHSLQSKIEHKIVDGYEVVSEKWEQFTNFDRTFFKGNSVTTFQLLKTMTANFIKKEKIEFKNTKEVQISKIRLTFIEDEVRQKISLILENVFGNCTDSLWIGILGRFWVQVETVTNSFLLLANTGNDFSIKFFAEMIKENILCFYLKSDNYNLYGDTDIWEAIDNRLKLLLKEFSSSHDFQSANEASFDEKSKDQQELCIHEAMIEGFHINLKLGILSKPLRMEINPTYSLELAKDLASLDDFGNKILENFLASMQTFCRSLGPQQAVKIVSFLMWRILKFIVLKQNFKRVNNSLYKILKSQFNRVFSR
jgi:hypothetical protein